MRAVVPATTLMSIFFFGIEELAVQLEEPFSILPLNTLCDSVWDGAVELFLYDDDSAPPRPVETASCLQGGSLDINSYTDKTDKSFSTSGL